MKGLNRVTILIFFASLLPILSQAQYVALPTSDVGDGKFLSIAGDRVSGGLDNQKAVLWLNIPAGTTSFNVAVFDGDQGGFWDITYNNPDVSIWRLYADPQKSLTGGQLVDSWTSEEMLDNAWYTRSVIVSDIARSPGGGYLYRLEISWQNPATSDDLNGFKVGTDVGIITAVPGNRFYFIGATLNTPGDQDGPGADPPTSYDGVWDFYIWVPPGLSRITFQEGDADWGPNGAPPDNNTRRPEFAVGDNISFTIYGPDGSEMPLSPPGSQPSGNRQFVTHILNASDLGLQSLPSGVYRWHWDGVDMHNQTVIIPSFELSSQPPSPVPVAGIRIEPDLSQTAYPGQTISFTHTVSNDESFPDVINVTVSSPLGWQISLFKGDGVTPLVDSNNDGIPDIGSVPGGSSTNLILKVSIPSSAVGGTVSNITVTVQSASTSASDQARDTITVASYQGLSITPDNSGTAKPGQSIVYQHQVKNNESFQDTIELIPTSSRGWTVVLLDEDGNPLLDTNGSGSIDTGPIGAGAVKNIKLRLILPQDASPGTTDTLTLLARSATTSLSDTATDVTTVIEPDKPKIEVTKSADRSEAKPGDLVTYTITYRNTGTATAYNLVFTDLIPQNTEFVSASGSGASISYRHAPGGGFDSSPAQPVIEVRWTVASLAPGETGSLTLVVRVK